MDSLSLLQSRTLAMKPNSDDRRVELSFTDQGFPLIRSRHPTGCVEWTRQAQSLVISVSAGFDHRGGYSTITDFSEHRTASESAAHSIAWHLSGRVRFYPSGIRHPVSRRVDSVSHDPHFGDSHGRAGAISRFETSSRPCEQCRQFKSSHQYD